MIQKEWRVPWILVDKIEEIRELMQQLNIHIIHIFREANQLADFITNTAIDSEGMLQFNNFNQLPSRAKRILNIDKMQIPNLRVRPRRILNNFKQQEPFIRKGKDIESHIYYIYNNVCSYHTDRITVRMLIGLSYISQQKGHQQKERVTKPNLQQSVCT